MSKEKWSHLKCYVENELMDKDRDKLQLEINKLRDALEKSVKLQSHYADLLNMYDGGERMGFQNADD